MFKLNNNNFDFKIDKKDQLSEKFILKTNKVYKGKVIKNLGDGNYLIKILNNIFKVQISIFLKEGEDVKLKLLKLKPKPLFIFDKNLNKKKPLFNKEKLINDFFSHIGKEDNFSNIKTFNFETFKSFIPDKAKNILQKFKDFNQRENFNFDNFIIFKIKNNFIIPVKSESKEFYINIFFDESYYYAKMLFLFNDKYFLKVNSTLRSRNLYLFFESNSCWLIKKIKKKKNVLFSLFKEYNIKISYKETSKA